MKKCKNPKDEPKGYVQWHEWAEKKSKTHNQLKCDQCGLFHIWKKKKKPIDQSES